MERKIIDLQRHKNEGLLENQSRIQALQKLITELKKQPDQALRTTAQAKGQTVREYRKETVQNLETVLKRLKEVNSQRYIDHQIRSSVERLSALRAHQSKVLDSQLVAERYKAKRWMASKMVDGKLHNYVGTLGHKRGLICVSRLKYHPLCQREIQAWGFVDYEAREVIPCQYGWAFNRLTLLSRFRWYTNTLIKFKSSPIWIEVPEPYRDSLGWITVGDFINQELMGMIDRENNVMIPLKFFWMEDRHEWIEFFYTPEGDFAPVTVKKENKLLDGIIDRKGNFTLEPVYETPIFWDKKRHCFYTDREQGKEEEEEEKERIYFNAYGEEIKNTK